MSEDKLLTLAKSLLESGDLGGAEDALAARVQIHPIPVDALLLLAEIRLRLGRSEDTLKLLAPYGGHRHCADWVREYCIGERMNPQAIAWLNGIPKSGGIDDLIDRMGAITRQLKSYARKGGDAFEPVDLRQCLSSALAMMEPQLKLRVVKITRSVPRTAVMVTVDRLRLEQVIINLLRNALDATKDAREPMIDLTLSADDTATLTVSDNGHGISDLENLFEPFYTTKKAGEGVGLGLAISSGIMTDFGGRLTARNGSPQGAVFEMQLPILGQDLAQDLGQDVKAAE